MGHFKHRRIDVGTGFCSHPEGVIAQQEVQHWEVMRGEIPDDVHIRTKNTQAKASRVNVVQISQFTAA